MKIRRSSITKTCLAAFFVVVVLLPLWRMLMYLGQTDIKAILASTQFSKSLRNSLFVSLISSFFSITLAFILAWCIERTTIKGKSYFSMAFTLPMLLPSVSHGMGLIILLGLNGIITNILHINWTIYGFWGIVIGSVMYSFPVAFLMISDIMKYEDSTPYEAAEVLGLSKVRQFCAITFPYMRRPMISVLFATFTMIVTDYGVPLMVGGKYTTLPVIMYQEVVGLLDFGKGSVIGSILLIPAVIAFIIDILDKNKDGVSYVTKPMDLKDDRKKNTLSYVICSLVSLLVIAPIIAFLYISFTKKYPVDTSLTITNIIKTMDLGGGRYLVNSLVISLFTALLGVSLGVATAYYTARMPSKRSKLLHLISITSLAIPGIVLGLSYILFFNGSFIYGTMIILIMVNMVHFFASPYLMIYNTFNKLNENLESVGMTLGVSRFSIFKDVILPQAKGTCIEMFSYFFVNSMMTISAVSFLATSFNKPLALMINQFQAQMLLECSAFVSFVILMINFIFKLLIQFINKRWEMRNAQ